VFKVCVRLVIRSGTGGVEGLLVVEVEDVLADVVVGSAGVELIPEALDAAEELLAVAWVGVALVLGAEVVGAADDVVVTMVPTARFSTPAWLAARTMVPDARGPSVALRASTTYACGASTPVNR
jgi:hypothetical protein